MAVDNHFGNYSGASDGRLIVPKVCVSLGWGWQRAVNPRAVPVGPISGGMAGFV
jgi:hypothetical protein